MQQHSPSASPYRRDAVRIGPVLCEQPDSSWRTGDEIRNGTRRWLTNALRAAGVSHGEHDHFVIGLLADDGWPTLQLVAGWIAPAHSRSINHADLTAGQRNERAPPHSDSGSAALSGRI
jgi:hypothetical protein